MTNHGSFLIFKIGALSVNRILFRYNYPIELIEQAPDYKNYVDLCRTIYIPHSSSLQKQFIH